MARLYFFYAYKDILYEIVCLRFDFFCIFAQSFVPKSEWAEGGQQTYLKGVESTLYLRLLESGKFYPTAR